MSASRVTDTPVGLAHTGFVVGQTVALVLEADHGLVQELGTVVGSHHPGSAARDVAVGPCTAYRRAHLGADAEVVECFELAARSVDELHRMRTG